jgi:hypothetical protein
MFCKSLNGSPELDLSEPVGTEENELEDRLSPATSIAFIGLSDAG